MHTELKAILDNTDHDLTIPNAATLQHAERILNYIEDINLERKNSFELTPDESLYMLWEVEEWEFHIECLKSGMVLYTFRMFGLGKANGTASINDFLNILEKYIIAAIC